MAEAEQAIIDRLLAEAEISAIVGARVYFTEAPQAPVLPYIVIFRVDGPRVHSLEGPSGLCAARIQVDAFAKTGKTARQIAREIRTSLDGFRGVQSTVSLQAVLLLDEMDGYEEAPEIKRVTQDYRVWYQE